MAFGALLCMLHGLPGAEKIVPIIENGTAAPIFMLPSVDGKRVSLRDYCGVLRNQWKNAEKQIVVLSFCASYCVPCRREIPQLEAFAQTAPKDVKVVFISVDSLGEQAAAPFQKEMNMKQTLLVDRYGQVMKKYGVKKLPSLFIIDKDGNMQFQSLNGFPEGLDLAKALAEKIEEIRKQDGSTVSAPQPVAQPSARDRKIQALTLLFAGKNGEEILRETGLSPAEYEAIKKEALSLLMENLN
ncbi:MAG: hypothetical protein A2487_12685 [Candidatus Raymondbacteria bacterium RifOxyC12_full_50_8]|uniref:Thioredoxin domain-containing protein n=1 Tax=Candidatus Raymondbacteria bacterium RIFOXYD12_FULL_49_13 TaxID=1817890 RepID=A0A1F7FC72_UNCRA|nr:MAG: hypothetical protein A2248_03075 [Candidatus Raymondbacteria bacterium RIFOXYA2_FULL_49_16]OGJ93461.1 MAG: hypothetical protein A2350_18995 [Candidatus Raymondbacteria bacterium RifOxyB12_full_50_8]OGK04280.1 MAG: hypothetical protein A2519_18130 [Candidatus Raymondbacteria bacterium RIFOXYD12_FULL_49_13]OGK07976.1 MAG: hypothetical protein A2487_12685 [Candidatus Raymondbacteria bacterium RifOxyC12_full_50_8]OGP42437.1 MAG: hypothetical protein A2324_17110 [Candidatus Raymondbacteria b